MSSFFGFVTSFCIVSAVLGALCILLPEGSFSKPLKYTFCACFICLVLSGVSVSLINTDFNIPSTDFEISSASEYASVLTFKTALKNAGIEFKDLTVTASKNASGGIDIIEVTVCSSENPEKIKEIIGNPAYEVNVIDE